MTASGEATPPSGTGDARSLPDARRELGDLLRTRRTHLVRAELGLPPRGRGTPTGLRREEVAFLSGVSVTWYTWLEQGRPINPSRQVLDAVARTLRLTEREHDYVLTLAGYAPRTADRAPVVDDAPPAVQRLLDALADCPAFAIAPDWGIAGWNAAYQALYPHVATLDRADRNLLAVVFTDPYVHDLLPDWEVTSARFLAEFRAEAGPRLGDPSFVALVDRLRDASPAFRAAWERRDVAGFASREREFEHPVVGRLHLEHHQLVPADHHEVQVVVYTPVPGTDAAARLHRMLPPPR